MKIRVFASLFALGSLLIPAAQAAPEPCSVSVGVTTRTGTFRTWTNALETQILEEKGLEICQDDAILYVSEREMANMTEKKAAALLKCDTEFKLELLYYKDNPKRPADGLTRNVTIFKGHQALFSRDYPPNPTSIGSLKILKTIPTCDQLHELAAKKAGTPAPTTGN